MQLQVWVLRVYKPLSLVYGEYRWHPADATETIATGGLPVQAGDEEAKRALRLIRISLGLLDPKGRRPGTGKCSSKGDFKATMIPLIRQCIADGQETIQDNVARYLAEAPRFEPRSAKQMSRQIASLSRLIRDYCHNERLPWAELVSLASSGVSANLLHGFERLNV
jgi:hypothetical protein